MSNYIFKNQNYCQRETFFFPKHLRSCFHWTEGGKEEREEKYFDKQTQICSFFIF